MRDVNIEERLRSRLRAEGDSLPFTISVDELERRLALHRRARSDRRMALLAAGVAAVAIGATLGISSGLFRGVVVGDDPTPGPSVPPVTTPAPSPSASVPPATTSPDPLGALPALVRDPAAVDAFTAERAGDPTDLSDVLEARSLQAVRQDARSAAVTVVCLGADAELTWGPPEDPRSIADERVACDGIAHRFDIDILGVQPIIESVPLVHTTPATSHRVLLETYGRTNPPAGGALPSFAIPGGTVMVDALVSGTGSAGAPARPSKAGVIAPRATYHVAVACLGAGNLRWSIGTEGAADFVVRGDIPCDGAAVGVAVSEGVPSEDVQVWVTTDPANDWRFVATDPFSFPDRPAFIAPPLTLSSEASVDGSIATGLGECVSWGDQGDSCAAPYSARDGAGVLAIPRGSSITAALAGGWTFTGARFEAAPRDDARLDGFAVTPVELGYLPDGGRSLTVSTDALSPGDWIVRVSVQGSRAGDAFGAYYDVPVTIAG